MCKRAGAYFYNVHPATATCSWMGSRQDEQSRKRASVILQEAISGVVRQLGSEKAKCAGALWPGKARNHATNPYCRAYKNTG